MAAERRLGPYILLEQVSSGAWTVTYRAEHAELGRAVLIKTLKPTLSARSTLAAGLTREARLLARVRHPNIVEIYDFRRDPDTIWLVLEALAGPSLADLLARADRLDPDAAAAIALEIARGLAHAHERGVVLCALRPEHIAITPGGGVKLLDVSAAEDTRAPSAGAAALRDADDGPFEVGQPLARPDTMAPEQILGDPTAPPADVFALGVVLFEMLTGERPFDPPPDDDAPSRTSSAALPRASSPRLPSASSPDVERDAQTASRAVAHRIRHAPPRPLRALAPDIPRDLERITLRCLEKDPEQRYPDGRALAAALESAIAERPRTPGNILIARALVAAKLVDDPAALPPALSAQHLAPSTPRPLSLIPELQRLSIILALIVAGGALIELVLRADDVPEPSPSELADADPTAHGTLRVLARPWAEVFVDGEPVGITPMARPIPVAPGRHDVTFRHPSAPEEKREVLVAAGQTVLLDVTLRIDRKLPDAGAPRSDEGESP